MKWSKLKRLFSCVKPSTKQNDYREPSSENVNQTLQILLLRSLQNQAEEREINIQLKTNLICLTNTLQASTGPRHSQSGALATQTETLVLSSSISASTSFTDFSSEATFLIPKGNFSKISHKSVQISLEAFSSSRVVAAHLNSFSTMNIFEFKISLIKHIRTLKQDVVALRQLLIYVEKYQNLGCMAVEKFGGEEQYKRAELRAKNFMKFHNLRKAGEKKKKGPAVRRIKSGRQHS